MIDLFDILFGAAIAVSQKIVIRNDAVGKNSVFILTESFVSFQSAFVK